ncbi:MAG: flagellar hook-length control protein FliK [Vagococcus sp.]|uniref:flagellar hook-length control protein FliK n=1 Tax=Vagococcus TaxID=2737 RepID=UPI002FC8BA6D
MPDMMNIDVSVLLNQEAVNMTGSTHSENSELFTELLNQHLHKNEEKRSEIEPELNVFTDSNGIEEKVELTDTTESDIKTNDKKSISDLEDNTSKGSSVRKKTHDSEKDSKLELISNGVISNIYSTRMEIAPFNEEFVIDSIKAEMEQNVVLAPQIVTEFKDDLNEETMDVSNLTSMDLDIASQLQFKDNININQQNEIEASNIIDLRSELNLPNKVLTREFINQLTSINDANEQADISMFPLKEAEQDISMDYKFSTIENQDKVVHLSDNLSVENSLKKEMLNLANSKQQTDELNVTENTTLDFVSDVAVDELVTSGNTVEEIINHDEDISLKADSEELLIENEEFGANKSVLIPDHSIQSTDMTTSKESNQLNSSERILFEEETVPNIVSKVEIEANNVTEFEPAQFKLAMKPENLGELEVVLTKKDGKLSAEFMVKDNVVKEALEQQLPKLQDSLFQQNIAIEKATVVVKLPTPHGFDFGGDLSQRQQNKQNQFKGNQQKRNYDSSEDFKEIEVIKEQDSINILV